MKNTNFNLLKTLCMTHGVNGDTSEIRKVVKDELKKRGIAYKEHGYGSIYFGNDTNPKKMVAAHIDEVGFQITEITSQGLLKFLPAGWVFPNRMDHNVVYIFNGKDMIPGLVVHQELLKEENLTDFASLSIDVGVSSREEVEKMGIKIGQFGSFQKNYYEQGNMILASSVDNRISVYVVICMVEENPELLKENMFIFHVDEETQDHNSRGICKEYKPDMTLVLDYCPIHQKKLNGDVLCNIEEGPLVMYRGGAYVLHERLRHFFDEKITAPFAKGFLSPQTLPGLEPAFFEENTHTLAVNICIPAMGYHGMAYSIRKDAIEKYTHLIKEVLQTKFV